MTVIQQDTTVEPAKPSSSTSGNYFREYSTRTSIHGFRYFGERRPCFEKFWWFVVFASCLAGCVYSIRLVYIKWDETPVIVTFNTVPYRIYNIPFPSVTVCTSAKIKREYYDWMASDTFWEEIKNTNNTEKKRFLSYASSVCPAITKKLPEGYTYETLKGIAFYEAMEKFSPNFTIQNCTFKREDRNCSEMFTKIITDAGICYTYNILDRNALFKDNIEHYKKFQVVNKVTNWTMDTGYAKDLPPDTYPERVLTPGAKHSLQFQLNISSTEAFQNTFCDEMVSGFMALLHIPMRVPRLTQHFIRIPLDNSVVAAVKPETMMTSEAIKIYSNKSRHCYFPSLDRELTYFRFYSQNNCEVECLTERLLKECGCVDYYMPHKKFVKICNGNDMECKDRVEQDLLQEEMNNDEILRGCNCLPLCVDVTYVSSTSQAPWTPLSQPVEETTMVDNETLFENITTQHFNASKFTVYFVAGDFIGSQRVALYGPTDFLANFGGLLSLFTGFSVLSLMEIIYFLTVRWCYNVRMFGRFTEDAN